MAYLQYVNTLSKPPETYESLLDKSQQCVAKALKINPDSAQAHFTQGCAYNQSGNPKGAIYHWTRAVELNPNDAYGMAMLGFQLAACGHDIDQARGLLETAMELDPLTPVNHGALAWLHMFNGEFRKTIDAMSAWQRELEEAKSPFLALFAWFYATSGYFDQAYRIIDSFGRENPDHVMTELMSFLKHAWLGQKEQALEYVTDRLEKAAWWDDFYSLWMAEGYALVGKHDDAFHWLDHAIDYGVTNVRFLEEHDAFLQNLRSDERFKILIDKARRLSESLEG
jgi:tetratricopeptide (TPR) repeat protein